MRLIRLLGVGFVVGAVAVCPAGAATSDKPDLVPILPTGAGSSQVAPVFVDTFQIPGRVLYRFDTVLMNQGGTLDLFRDKSTGDAMQAIWPGGSPPSGYVADPNVAPSGPGITIEDRTQLAGASLAYSALPGHNHWHYAAAARYELDVPGASKRVAAKVGFCLFDSWGGVNFFPGGYRGTGPDYFCAPSDPGASFVRMGLSPGLADYYNSQLTDQWIDVTGLPAGQYTLRGIANPNGYVDERSTANNVVEETRTIPGATAAPVTEDVPSGTSTTIQLAGTVVGAEILARKSGQCTPSRYTSDCYVSGSAKGPLDFSILQRPAHGTVSITSQSGLGATAAYKPATGYSGPDLFTYTTTDGRGLTSAAATVQLNVGGGGSSGPANDAFAAAQGLTGSSGTATGTNIGASKEKHEPKHDKTGGKSVWYSWMAPGSGTATIDTAGSSFDTLLAVYTGSSVSQLTQVAASNDVSKTDSSSRVTFAAVAGTVYKIAVDGRRAHGSVAQGSISLHWHM